MSGALWQVSAPGKAILIGEYAVLEGAACVSVAVDRVVTARIDTAQSSSPTPFVAAAVAHATRALETEGRRLPADFAATQLVLDSTPLYVGARKLGLGSSAAVTAAAVGAVFVACDAPLEPARVFAVAQAAHAEAQGVHGSGVDVATSTWGGTILFRRTGDDRAPTVTPLSFPPSVALTFVDSGQSASTADLLTAVRRLATAQPLLYGRAMARLGELADEFAMALQPEVSPVHSARFESICRSVEAYREILALLGHAADVDLVTPAHRTIARIAHRFGAAAKPSGAGGGDLAVVFSRAGEATASLHGALTAAGLAPLSLTAPHPGLRPHLENA